MSNCTNTPDIRKTPARVRRLAPQQTLARPFEHDHWDLPHRLLAVVAEARIDIACRG